MKLKLEDEIFSLPYTEDMIHENDNVTSSSSDVKKMLSEGIEAAQNGNRSEARHLLLRVSEEDPKNETAWLWLGSISEYPEELLIFLNNVLEINPQNERALKWTEETKAFLAKTFVQRGIDAEKDDQKDLAKQCFLQAIVNDNKNEMAWMWLASVSDSDEEKTSHLRKVLKINPSNEKAMESLERVQRRTADSLLAKAKSCFYDNAHENAEKFVNECLKTDPNHEEAILLKSELVETYEDKISLIEKVLEISPENRSAQAAIEAARLERVPSLLSAAKTAIENEETEKAEELLNSLLSDSPKVIDAWFLKADNAGSSDEKIKHINKVIEIDPSNQLAAEELTGLKRTKAGEFVVDAEKAISDGEHGKARDLIDGALECVPEFEAAMLLKYELIDSLDEKTQLLNLVLENNPKSEKALMFLKDVEKQTLPKLVEAAETAVQSDDLVKAQEILESAMQINQEDVGVLLLKAKMADSIEEKETILERVFEIDPQNKKADAAMREMKTKAAAKFLAKASVAAKAGEKPKARIHLEKAVEYAPDLEDAWLLKAHLTESFENKIECFEKILKINPDNAVAKANLDSLKTLLENSVANETSIEEPVQNEDQDKSLDPDESNAQVFEESPEEGQEDEYVKTKEPDTEKTFESIDTTDEFSETLQNTAPFEMANDDFVSDEIDIEETAVENEAAIDSGFEQESTAVSFHDTPAEIDEITVEETFVEQEVNTPEMAPAEIPETIEDLSPFESETIGEFDMSKDDDSLIEVSDDANGEFETENVNGSSPSNKILIVDDNPTIRKLISGKLNKSGYDTICAVDGVDAINKMVEIIPGLILLDIGMPKMDGYQVCKTIRENEATKDVPIIMISSKDGLFDEELARKAGSTTYISKPFGPEALMKIVQEHLVNVDAV